MSDNRLFAPPQYWNMGEPERAKRCNGCGTKGWKGEFIPDTMYGLSVKEACNIHDVMYIFGRTDKAKVEADRVFLINMNRLINDGSKFFLLRMLRRSRARKYYLAVKYFGGPAFWSGKNEVNNYG